MGTSWALDFSVGLPLPLCVKGGFTKLFENSRGLLHCGYWETRAMPSLAEVQQREQVEKNFKAFQALLPTILPTYQDKFALMKDGEAVGFYSTLEDAYMTANKFFRDEPFSVQKVTETPVDLGFFSHAVCSR
jgi:hypothetical protein